MSPEKKPLTDIHPTALRKLTQMVFLPLTLAIVSVANFSAAIDQLHDAYNSVKNRLLANSIDYARLQRIHVGNTRDYVNQTLGTPAVVKTPENNEKVNTEIIFHEKYVFSGYYENERLRAYSVLTLAEDFNPPLPWSQKQRLIAPLETVLPEPKMHYADYSATLRYYLAESYGSVQSRFVWHFAGRVQYQPDAQLARLLSQLAIPAGTSQASETLIQFRQSTAANLYGEADSVVTMAIISKGLLTAAEFDTYLAHGR